MATSSWMMTMAPPMNTEEEVSRQLVQTIQEEERLLDEMLEEQHLQDKAWSHRLDEVMRGAIDKQMQLEAGMEEFLLQSQESQDELDAIVEKVKRLVVDYPITPSVTGYREHDVSTAVQQKEILDVEAMNLLRVASTRVGRVVLSKPFEYFFAIVILVNGFFIGFSVEYGLKHADEDPSTFLQICELTFFALYTIELVLKMFAYARVGLLWHGFFRGQDWMWNLFDLVLVLTAIYDIITDATAESAEDRRGGSNLMWMRLLRLLKMAKMLRMVRVMRFFRELRIIIGLVGKSIRSLCWALLMVALIIYIFGLVFLQGAQTYVSDNHENIPIEVQASLDKYWNTLSNSMYTLFAAITMGIDYTDATAALREVGEFYHVLFLAFVGFMMFAVLNVLSGIFVDSSFEAAEEDRLRVIREVKQDQAKKGNHFRDLFQDWCDKGPDFLSHNAFVDCLKWDPNVTETLSYLEIDKEDALDLFDDCYGGNNKVSTDDIAHGLQRLKGDAMSVDLVVMEHNCRKFAKEVEAFMKYVEEYFNKMRLAMETRFGHSHRSKMVVSLTARMAHARKMPVKLFS